MEKNISFRVSGRDWLLANRYHHFIYVLASKVLVEVVGWDNTSVRQKVLLSLSSCNRGSEAEKTVVGTRTQRMASP